MINRSEGGVERNYGGGGETSRFYPMHLFKYVSVCVRVRGPDVAFKRISWLLVSIAVKSFKGIRTKHHQNTETTHFVSSC